MFFETKVRVVFKKSLEEKEKSIYIMNTPTEDDVQVLDNSTMLFSWRYFHCIMSTILMIDGWSEIYEVWPNGKHGDLELYFNRSCCKETAPAFKFYIDMSPTRAIVVCPQLGTLEFREIFLDTFGWQNITPSKEDYKIFVRRYYSWVILRDYEMEKLEPAFKEITGVSFEEFYSIYEK